jgi:nucleoside phosphorylase
VTVLDCRRGQLSNRDKLKTTLALGAVAFLISFSVEADTAILVALPAEQSALSRKIRIVGQPVEIAQHKVSIGYRKGEKVYLVKTGAGNLNSAMVTQALLTRYRMDWVISIGVAGYVGEGEMDTTEIPRHARDDNQSKQPQAGTATPPRSETSNTVNREPTSEDWKIGDILIVTNVVSHQVGKETPAGFEVREQQTEVRNQKSEEYWRKCEELRSSAVEIAQNLLRSSEGEMTSRTTEIPRQARNDSVGIPNDNTKEQPQASTPVRPGTGSTNHQSQITIHEGRLVSGDSFIASSAKRKWLRETFHADAVDMVSAGIARVCEANGVPYVILRALSDNADETASADFASFVQKYKEPVTATIAVRLVDEFTPSSQHPSR